MKQVCMETRLWIDYYLITLVVLSSRVCFGLLDFAWYEPKTPNHQLKAFHRHVSIKFFANESRRVKHTLPQTFIQCSRTVTSNPILAGLLFSGSVEALAAATRKEKSTLSAAQKGNDCSLLPLSDCRTGCQWHRQCAFVYVPRTSVPNHITHKPQRGGLVCVCVCFPLCVCVCVCVWAIDWCVIWE